MRRPRTRISSLAPLILSAALLWTPIGASALGLGKLTLHSGLDEPLSAEIELTAATSGELKTLRSGLASRSEFDAAGVEWAPHLAGIKYTVVTRADGTPVLQLSSEQPIREPFLHFLLQVEWTGGRLIREYTALLDPPYLAASKPIGVEPPVPLASAEVVTEESVAAETSPAAVTADSGQANVAKVAKTASDSEAQATVVPAPGEEAAPSEEALAKAESPAPEESSESTPPTEQAQAGGPERVTPAHDASGDWATATEYGPVKKGDTLWKIAERMRADESISLEQTMLALMKANKQAFINNNMNNLKTGKILKIPERSAVESISQSRALREFRAQYDAWQEYKLKLASTSRTLKVTAAQEGGAAAKGVIAEAAQAPTATDGAAGAQGSTDLLKIVRANINEQPQGTQTGKPAGGGTEQAALAERVAMLEEALESKQLENKELRERIAHLETQVKNAQRLIEIESARLAQAQQQAGAATGQKPAPAPAAAAPAAAPSTKPAAPPPAAKPPVVAKSPVAPKLEEERSFIDEALNNPLSVPAAGGLGVVIIGTLLLYYRRRRRSIAEFEESILSGGGLNSEGTSSNPNDGANDVSLLSDFSQGGMGNIHTDEVDPIAEAEVYLAYGRDEQAEEILREAIVKDPQRMELRQKLAEIYHQRNDLSAFETLAEELYAALGGKGGKVWDKVADMGRKMNPSNPMFRTGAAAGIVAAAAGAAAPKFSVHEAVADSRSATSSDMEFTQSAMAPVAESLDFDLGNVAPMEGNAPGMDFAVDLDGAGSAPAPVEPAVSAASTEASGGLDMDFGALSLDSPGGGSIDFEVRTASSGDDVGISFDTESTQLAQPDEAAAGLGDIEWNIDEGSLESVTLQDLPQESSAGDFEGLVSSDEIATKLDLAKAYIDMGDGEGARSILDEVLAEGNDAQKRQAADLAAQIG